MGELKRLSTSYNPDANLHLEKLEELASRNEETGRDNLLETANFVREAVMKNQEGVEKPMKYVEPKTFQEAYNHPDPKQRKLWREGIRKEFRDMINRKVWRKESRTNMPDNRRCVKCKWVFKIKRNGVF